MRSYHPGAGPVYYLSCPVSDGTVHMKEGLVNALQIEEGRLTYLPMYLTIQLQRVNPGESGLGKKDLREVDYPLELDVSDLCSEELKNILQSNKENSLIAGESTADLNGADSHELVQTKSGIFDLIAVIAHQGKDATAGHYDIFVKQENNKWIRFNDEEKCVVGEDDVMKFTGAGNGAKTASVCLYKARVLSWSEIED